MTQPNLNQLNLNSQNVPCKLNLSCNLLTTQLHITWKSHYLLHWHLFCCSSCELSLLWINNKSIVCRRKCWTKNHKGAKLFIYNFFLSEKSIHQRMGKIDNNLKHVNKNGRVWEHSIEWVNCRIISISSGRIRRNWAYNSYLIAFNSCCKWLTLPTCRSNAVNNFHDFVVFELKVIGNETDTRLPSVSYHRVNHSQSRSFSTNYCL